jgi:LEA14-like dessication related protein
MKRKISFTALVLILLIILNVMIGGVLVFFIQEIKEPKLDVHFNLTQLTTENLKFTASISTRNDNPYDLVIKNLIIIGRTPKGDIILDVQIKGGSVGANQFRVFTTDGTLAFPGDLSSRIYTSINGVFGVNIAGIFEKTIPFQINITGSFQDLFQNISIPTLSIQAEVTEITENGVLFQGLLRVENPNLFELIIEDMTVRVQTENNDLVGEFSKIEGAIRANNTTEFSLNGSLFYDALNAKVLSLIVTGSAGAHLMGIEKTVLLSTTAQLLIPEIK